MATTIGEVLLGLAWKSTCQILPLRNYLKTWKISHSLEKYGQEDDTSIDSMQDDQDFAQVMEQVVSNYVIMRKVMKYLYWQDLKICSMVNKLWNDISNNILKEKRDSENFFFVTTDKEQRTDVCKVFDRAQTEPLLVLVFFNKPSLLITYKCGQFGNPMCSLRNHGVHNHYLLDYVNIALCYPGNPMLGVCCSKLVFIGKNEFMGNENGLFNNVYDLERLAADGFPFIGGLVLPPIVDLEVRQVKASGLMNAARRAGIVERIAEAMKNNVVKCVFIFISGMLATRGAKYIDKCVKKMKELQPNEPFALGGCAVYALADGNSDDYSKLDNKFEVHFIMLTMPRTSTNPDNFNAYSALMQDGKNRHLDFNSKMEQFATSVTKRKYSAAVKLSCTDRRDMRQMEGSCWKKYFPKTTLVGCYGLGEIGADCYPNDGISDEKRSKGDEADTVMHSFCTVLIYLTWGDKVD